MLFCRRAFIPVLAAVTAAVLLVGNGPALSIDIPIGGTLDLRGNGRIDLHILESRQRRQAYQAQQRHYREQDRQITGADRQRPEIPLMQGSCRVSGPGNKFLKRCR